MKSSELLVLKSPSQHLFRSSLKYLFISICRKKRQNIQQALSIYRAWLHKNHLLLSVLQTLHIILYYFHGQIYFLLMLYHSWGFFYMLLKYLVFETFIPQQKFNPGQYCNVVCQSYKICLKICGK